MRNSLVAVLALCLVACGPMDENDVSEESEAVTSPDTPLRLLTGDSTTIHSNGTATEAGRSYVYEPVDSGSPKNPWISSAHFSGAHAIAFEVPSDHSGAKQRIEYKIAQAKDSDGLHFDNARYSGFAFKLAPNPASFESSTIIWQAWQGSPYSPPIALKLRGSSAPYRLILSVRNMSTGPNPSPDIEVFTGSVVQPNVWYSVELYIEPRYNSSGSLKFWLNGVQRANWTGQIGYDPNKVSGAFKGLDIKNGIYQPDPNNGHLFYFDQIKFGKTFASATP